MPATSKSQFRFMAGVASGDIKAKGLSPKKASEFISGQSPDNLPEKVKSKSLHRIVDRMGKAAKGNRWRQK